MYYMPVKNRSSLGEFFEHGPSLWRWVKYGHGKSVPYVDPFSADSLTAPAAPFVSKRISNLLTKPLSLPSILQNRAVCFRRAAMYFSSAYDDYGNGYPGDGYLFFMDPYFTEGSFPQCITMEEFHFYNYIYSYRNLIGPALYKNLSGLRGRSILAILYEYRSHIFSDALFFKTLNNFSKSKLSREEFGLVLLGRLLGRPLKNPGTGTGEFAFLTLENVLTLLEAYTLEAARHILFGPAANPRRIINSINLVIETRSLIEGALPRRFTSPAELLRYHDQEAGNRRNKNAKWLLCSEYKWPDKLVDLVNSVSAGEWRIPISPFELISRSKTHSNCVDSYIERHFKKPHITETEPSPHKKLLLFSDEAEAEIYLYFAKPDKADTPADKPADNNSGKPVCVRTEIMQCKTIRNKDYPSLIPERLCAAFIGCGIDLFEASVAVVQEEAQVVAGWPS